MPARRKNELLQERHVVSLEVPSTAATLTLKFYKVPAGRTFRVDRVSYINPTGLATDASNYFVVTVKNGSTVVATLANTNSSGGAALTADTFVEGTLSATESQLAYAAADIMSFVATKTGTQTLPAGRLVVEGRLL